MKKRILSVLLTVCMVLTLLPAVTFGAAAADITGTVTESAEWNAGDTISSAVSITGGTADAPVVITVTGEVTVSGTITVASGYVKFVGGTGGGTLKRGSGFVETVLSVSGGANVTLERGAGTLTIDGNENNHSSAIIIVSTGGALTTNSGVTIRNSKGAGDGGGRNGGVQVSGTFNMNGGVISGNTTAYSGGGVQVSGIFNMNGGVISGNSAPENGGGVYNTGRFTMTGGSITGNTGTFEGRGGGVFNSSPGTFTMTGGSISGNTVADIGGGVYNDGTFHISGSASVVGNTSGNEEFGGLKTDNVYISDEGNAMKVSGALTGGVGVTCGSTPTTAAIVAVGEGYTPTADDAKHIFYDKSYDNTKIYTTELGENTVTATAHTAVKLTVKSDGGDHSTLSDALLAAADYTIIDVQESQTVTETLSVSTANNIVLMSSADATLTRDSLNDGAMLSVSGSGASVTLGKGVTIDGSSISSSSPAVLADDGARLLLDGAVIRDNVSTDKSGGVCVSDGSFFLMNSGTITGNTISPDSGGNGGGGVRVSGTESLFIMNGGTINHNQTSSDSEGVPGGGVYLQSGEFSMNYGEISANTVSIGSGGGICVEGGVFHMTGGSIIDNTAEGSGGGVYGAGGTFAMTGGSITGNSADDCGGGVYVSVSDKLRVSGCADITDNTGSNVYLPNNVTLTVDGPLSGSIGVTSEEMAAGKVIAVGASSPAYTVTAADAACFSDDDSSCEMQVVSASNSISYPGPAAPIFDARNGSAAASAKPSPDPAWESYVFGGWYTGIDGTGTALGENAPAAGMTYYAKWKVGSAADAKTVRTAPLDITTIETDYASMAATRTGSEPYYVYTNAAEGWTWTPKTFGDTPVSEENCSGVLELSGFTLHDAKTYGADYTNNLAEDVIGGDVIGLKLPAYAVIKLSGDNAIIAGNLDFDYDVTGWNYSNYGVYIDKRDSENLESKSGLLIKGSGSLDVQGGNTDITNATSINAWCCGIYLDASDEYDVNPSSIIMDSGALKVTAGSATNEGTGSAGSYGIMGAFRINGGTLEATAGTATGGSLPSANAMSDKPVTAAGASIESKETSSGSYAVVSAPDITNYNRHHSVKISFLPAITVTQTQAATEGVSASVPYSLEASNFTMSDATFAWVGTPPADVTATDPEAEPGGFSLTINTSAATPAGRYAFTVTSGTSPNEVVGEGMLLVQSSGGYHVGGAPISMLAGGTGAGSGWTWTQSNKTLTLYGVDISVTSGEGVLLPGGSTVELVGVSKVTSSAADAIKCTGDLTIGGSGILEATSDTKAGISAWHDDNSASLTINGGYIKATGSHFENGIYAKSGITVTGGFVDASGNNDVLNGIGIYNGGAYSQSGGYVKTIGNEYGLKADAGTISISGGYLEAKGAVALLCATFTNDGGVVKATGSNWGIHNTGNAAAFSGGVTIAKGTTKAINGSVTYGNNEAVKVGGAVTAANTEVVIAKAAYNTKQTSLPESKLDGVYINTADERALDMNGGTLNVTGGSYCESTNANNTAVVLSGNAAVTGSGTLVGYSGGARGRGVYISGSVTKDTKLIGVSESGSGAYYEGTSTTMNIIGVGEYDSNGQSAGASCAADFSDGSIIGVVSGSSTVNDYGAQVYSRSGNVSGGSITGYSESGCGVVIEGAISGGNICGYGGTYGLWLSRDNVDTPDTTISGGTIYAYGGTAGVSLSSSTGVPVTAGMTSVKGATSLGGTLGDVSYDTGSKTYKAGGNTAKALYMYKASAPTITVGAQSGALTYGTAGSVTFTVTASNFTTTAYAPAIEWVMAEGNRSGVTVTVAGTTVTAEITAAANAGNYEFKVKSGTVQSESVTLIVGAAAQSAPTGLYVDFADEKITGYNNSTMEYSIDGVTYVSTKQLATAGELSALIPDSGASDASLYIRLKADGNHAVGTATSAITIPARPATPAHTVSYAAETTGEVVPATVEYNTTSATAPAASWTAGTGVAIGLTPGTGIFFRVKAISSAFASAVQTLDVPSRPAAPASGITASSANGTAAQTTKLTFTYSAGSYEYTIVANGATPAANAVWTPVPSTTVATADISSRANTDDVYVRVKAVISSGTQFASAGYKILDSLSISKNAYTGTQAGASAAVVSKTDTTVTLDAVTAIANEAIEYGYSTTNVASSVSSWQDSNVFTGLSANMLYYFFARVKESNDHYAGAASAPLSVTTKTAAVSAPTAPGTPASADKTATSIKIAVKNGEEYKVSTNAAISDWSGSHKPTADGTYTFTGLTAGTQYYIHYRTAETETAMPSTGGSIESYTLAATPTASDFTVTQPTATSGDAGKGSVTKPATGSYEYRISTDNGTTWSPNWTDFTTDLTAITAPATIEVRIKAAGSVPASAARTITISSYSPPSSPSGSGGGSTTPTTPAAPVIVGGKSENIGKTETTTTETKVTVDSGKLTEKVDSAEAGASVIVPVSDSKTTATAQLVVKNVETMAEKQMVLEVKVGSVSYKVPAAAIDTKTVMAELGAQDATKVPVAVTITKADETVQTDVKVSAQKLGAEVIGTPMQFTVTASYGGKTTNVTSFEQYVQRVVEVTAEQAQKITTAIVREEDGTLRHVPTYVTEKDGKYYARINSKTNSTYAFIYNEVRFADAAGQWYEAVVNEMASRKIINGRSDNTFDGAADVTRAEFAALTVRALGLPTNSTAASVFKDVPASSVFYGAIGTAVEYGIVKGKTATTYAPDAAITRQEAMVMLARAAKVAELTGKTGDLSVFSDAASVGAWAKDAVAFNVGTGLIVGTDGRLNLSAPITRAQTAVVLLRLLQKAQLVDIRTQA